ncbi:unnamed protein product [Ascophyllum nodosum]
MTSPGTKSSYPYKSGSCLFCGLLRSVMFSLHSIYESL